MSAVDPSVASTIPLFFIFLSHVSGAHLRCYSACAVPRGAARCQKKRVRAAFSERPPEAHCGFISIDPMARQTPTSSKNVCCGSQRSIACHRQLHFFHLFFARLGSSFTMLIRMLGPFQRGLRKLIVDYFHRSDGAPGCAPDADLVQKCPQWIPA